MAELCLEAQRHRYNSQTSVWWIRILWITSLHIGLVSLEIEQGKFRVTDSMAGAAAANLTGDSKIYCALRYQNKATDSKTV